MCHFWRRLICNQHFHNHPTGLFGAVRAGVHDHAFGDGTDAGGDQRPLPFHFDHTGAAIAVGPVSRLVAVTQMGNDKALAFGDVPNRLSCWGRNLCAIKGECDCL